MLCLAQKWARAMCPGTCCSDFAGRPEHLDRATAHPMEVEGDINNGAYRPLHTGRIPAVPGEPLGLSSPLYPACPMFVVRKAVPCRRSPVRLYAQGGCGTPLGAEHALRAPGAQHAGRRSLARARWECCSSCLLPLLRGKRLGQRSSEGAAATLQVGHSPLLELPLPCGSGGS